MVVVKKLLDSPPRKKSKIRRRTIGISLRIGPGLDRTKIAIDSNLISIKISYGKPL